MEVLSEEAAESVGKPMPPSSSYSSSSSPGFSIKQQADKVEELPEVIVTSLMAVYQGFVHPHWPILSLASLSSPRVLEQKEPMLYHAILAATALTQRGARQQESRIYSNTTWTPNTISRYFESRARKSITQLAVPNRAAIQTLKHLAALQMGRGEYALAWHDIGIAARAVQNLQLHRKCTRLETVAQRARYREDRQECDVDLPGIQDREEYDVWLTDWTLPLIHSANVELMVSVEMHTLSSFRVWCEIMILHEQILQPLLICPDARSMYHMHDDTISRTTNIYEQLRLSRASLQRWKERLPLHLDWQSPLLLSSPGDRTFANSSLQDLHDRMDEAIICHRGVAPQILTMRAWYCASHILLYRSSHQHRHRAQRNRHGAHSSATRRPSIIWNLVEDEDNILVDCQPLASELCAIMAAYETTFELQHIPSHWCHLIFQAATIHLLVLSLLQNSSMGTSDVEGVDEGLVFSQTMLDMCIRWLEVMSSIRETASQHLTVLKKLGRVMNFRGMEEESVNEDDDDDDEEKAEWTRALASCFIPGISSILTGGEQRKKASLSQTRTTTLGVLSERRVSDEQHSMAPARNSHTDISGHVLMSQVNNATNPPSAEGEEGSNTRSSTEIQWPQSEAASIDGISIWESMPVASEDLQAWHNFFETFTSPS
ncbi:hypothetical protein CBS101457_003115 [Exobasidium rhododendri]|nr:hypothetical protein CBS101457_003115 [Exobasidium rhododendri]